VAAVDIPFENVLLATPRSSLGFPFSSLQPGATRLPLRMLTIKGRTFAFSIAILFNRV